MSRQTSSGGTRLSRRRTPLLTPRHPPVIAALAFVILISTSGLSFGQGKTTWYLAEGATGIFDTEILIANPHDVDIDIRITWGLPAGTPPVAPTTFTMAATSRKTVRVKELAGLDNTAVSALVESLARPGEPARDIVVERSMYWRHGGWPKGHTSMGVLEPATTWHLAEGATGDFRDFILIYNPSANPDEVADVALTFLREGLPPVGPIVRHVQGGERHTVFVNADVPEMAAASFATRVVSTNDVPIIVERAMYFPMASDPWLGRGGHESAGITAPAARWIFGEGVAGDVGVTFFDTFLLLSNPGPTTANVTVIYAKEGGQRLEQTPADDPELAIAPNRRKTIWVNHDVPGFDAGSFSMEIVSDAPILAERAVYWGAGTPASWIEAHNSPGATAEALAWGFAEGLDGGFDLSGLLYQSYFLVANTNTTSPLEIAVTFFREDGTGFVQRYEGATAIAPGTRFTISSWEIPELSQQRFATFIESVNDVPFVAERAVYWGVGFVGGHNSVGTPWDGPVATPPPAPPPSLLNITPNVGPVAGGMSVTIRGNNLGFPATVTIGGVPASDVLVWNASTITATAPPGAPGKQNVEVTCRGVTRTMTAAYTYVAPAPPVISRIVYAVSPSYGGEEVRLEGAHFTPSTMVTFGGVPAAAVSFDSIGQLRVVTPPHAAGATYVQVSDVAGSTSTPADAFTFLKRTATDRILAFGDGITLGLTDCTIVDDVRVCATQTGGYPSHLKSQMDSRYAAQAPTIVVDNLGQVDELAPQGVARLQALLGSPNVWDVVVLMEGMEDVTNRVVYSTAQRIAEMVAMAKQAGKLVVLCTLTPVAVTPWNPHPTLVSDFNTLMRQLAASEHVVLADLDVQFRHTPGFLSGDGMHPTPLGYELMAEFLAGIIEANFEAVWRPVP